MKSLHATLELIESLPDLTAELRSAELTKSKRRDLK